MNINVKGITNCIKEVYYVCVIIATAIVSYKLCRIDYDWSSILSVVIIVSTSFLVSQSSYKKYALILFTSMLLIRILAAMLTTTEPVSDFEIMYTSAQELLDGNNDMLDNPYYYRWAYQSGMVLYLALCLSICNSLLFLKIINCFWSAGICVLIYFIARVISNERAARFVSLLYGLFMFPLLFNTVLSNQIPATFLFYLAVYLCLIFLKDNKKASSFIIPGILLGIGNIIRPEAIIFVISIIGWLILSLDKVRIRKGAIIVGVVVLAFLITTQTSSFLVKYAGINEEGLSNNEPEWKFVLGLNLESDGGWNQDDVDKYAGNVELERMIIKERIASLTIGTALRLVLSKETEILSSGTLFWSLQECNPNTFSYLSDINDCLYYFIFILMIIGVITQVKRNRCDALIVFINIVAVTMAVYALIEVQDRYAFIVQVSIFIIASKGYEKIYELINKKYNEFKQN